MKVCYECGGLNKHLRSCSQNEEESGNHYSKHNEWCADMAGSCDSSLDDLDIPGLCDT